MLAWLVTSMHVHESSRVSYTCWHRKRRPTSIGCVFIYSVRSMYSFGVIGDQNDSKSSEIKVMVVRHICVAVLPANKFQSNSICVASANSTGLATRRYMLYTPYIVPIIIQQSCQEQAQRFVRKYAAISPWSFAPFLCLQIFDFINADNDIL